MARRFRPISTPARETSRIPIVLRPAATIPAETESRLQHRRRQRVFRIGWSLDVPSIRRKTSHGIPRYRDLSREASEHDTFILSGAEDLVPLGSITDETGALATRYRPRTEGLFAEIHRYRGAAQGDYWRVRSKDGLTSYFRAVLGNPARPAEIFAWR